MLSIHSRYEDHVDIDYAVLYNISLGKILYVFRYSALINITVYYKLCTSRCNTCCVLL